MRRTISVLVVVGLAIAVALLLINRDGEAPSETLADASTTTTSVATTVPESTTSTASVTTTSPTEVHVVETVEEAEAILRELWFGWFEGIYNEDEDRIREVVGNSHLIADASDEFGVMEFHSPPSRGLITLSETEVLLATESCTAIWSVVNAEEIVGAVNDGVHIFVKDDGRWLFISQWANRDDLWEADCQSQLPS